jgi:hypothetical protein
VDVRQSAKPVATSQPERRIGVKKALAFALIYALIVVYVMARYQWVTLMVGIGLTIFVVTKLCY